MRTVALYNKNLIVLFVLSSLGVAVVATDIAFAVSNWSGMAPDASTSGVSTCNINLAFTGVQEGTSALLAAIFDSAVFGFTLWKTARLIWASRRQNMRLGLVSLVARDGAFYYCPLIVLNVINVSLAFKSASLAEDFQSLLGTVNQTLPVLIVNRLIMNLRQYTASTTIGSASSPSAIHTTLPEPVFAQNAILGNMGAPLDHLSEQEQEEYDDNRFFKDEEAHVEMPRRRLPVVEEEI